MISSPDRPVEVLEIPEPTSVLQLEVLAQKLDATGIDFEVLRVSRNATVEELTNDVERSLDDEDPDDFHPQP